MCTVCKVPKVGRPVSAGTWLATLIGLPSFSSLFFLYRVFSLFSFFENIVRDFVSIRIFFFYSAASTGCRSIFSSFFGFFFSIWLFFFSVVFFFWLRSNEWNASKYAIDIASSDPMRHEYEISAEQEEEEEPERNRTRKTKTKERRLVPLFFFFCFFLHEIQIHQAFSFMSKERGRSLWGFGFLFKPSKTR